MSDPQGGVGNSLTFPMFYHLDFAVLYLLVVHCLHTSALYSSGRLTSSQKIVITNTLKPDLIKSQLQDKLNHSINEDPAESIIVSDFELTTGRHSDLITQSEERWKL